MIEENNKTLWCGNLPEQVTEELLYELFLQAGPLEKVRIPEERDGRQKNFALITYRHEISVPYAIKLFRGTSLFHRTLSLQCRGRMPILPPPIRCYGLESVSEFSPHSNVAKQSIDMAESFKEDDFRTVHPIWQGGDKNPDRLVIASLQGNWPHRHHPYRSKDKMHRSESRRFDNVPAASPSGSRGSDRSHEVFGAQRGESEDKRGTKRGPSQRLTAHMAVAGNPACGFCDENGHDLGGCAKFLSQRILGRRYFVLQRRWCYICFGKHTANVCPQQRLCTGCNERHHPLLCLNGDSPPRSKGRGQPASPTRERAGDSSRQYKGRDEREFRSVGQRGGRLQQEQRPRGQWVTHATTSERGAWRGREDGRGAAGRCQPTAMSYADLPYDASADY